VTPPPCPQCGSPRHTVRHGRNPDGTPKTRPKCKRCHNEADRASRARRAQEDSDDDARLRVAMAMPGWER